ncbi:alpha/beta fold hydrolase [Achromobacter insolitus]|jgi:pimeloyl-ACP methyl ester carboxylesterase|uniref:(E)-2-((N-methylformamido)methylene)succinate hydrolase n=1 Tax=Achromobacter insolitus TaxID=217204 RepID=A0A6S7F0U7_9BURK|nr:MULTISPECIES: alpha/beta fold hydrolase [Achromobacter]APX78557.1 3-oxoadipate enol-lactonase [Achromobacter insolitus]AXA72100.1 3-oxoadipate enol-lactonase [Achromobacter insolitus]MEB3099103.1 alpha/beta fold hydrolase [Achromobacter sp. D10]OAE62320.1 3-oxoadipate enol-lactonase [Achromobacter insolitus]OCZ62768.1 3-oxoadipate enol-lactonase [Achromobacter insolitus]
MSAHFRRSGRGEPLVLLHGVGLDHTLWDDLAPLLEPDFEVLRYDMLGHGHARAIDESVTVQDFIAQLDTELDRAGWKSANVLGYSMGGLIAGAYAAARPQRVTRLALLSTVFQRNPDEARAVLARLDAAATQDRQAAAEVSLQRWFTPAFQARCPERVTRIGQRLLHNNRASFLAAYRIFALGDTILAQAASGIACPALVMTGELDVGSTPRMTRELASALPQAQAQVVPGQRHMLPVEEPAIVAAALQGFLLQASGAPIVP